MYRKSGKTDFFVEEEVKIAVNIALERFKLSEDLQGNQIAIK